MTQQTSPTPPKVGRPDGLAPSSKGAPENVRDGVRAWYIVGAVQALTAVVQLVMNLQDPRALTTQVRDQMDSVSLPDGVTEETLVTGTAILNLLLMLAAVALCMFLNRRVSRGGVRSRLFLCVGSVYLALMALVQVFSTPPDTGATPLVLLVGAGTIVSGVVAAVGIWLITRPENADWFGLPDKAEIEAYAEKLARRNEQLDKERAEKKKRRRQAREDRDSGKNAGTNGQKDAEKKNRGR